VTQVPAPTSPPAAPGAFAALRRRYARLSPDMRRRLPALALTLAIEVLLVLMLLSLGSAKREIAEMRDTLVAFTSPEAQDEPDEARSPEPARPQPPAASSAAAPRAVATSIEVTKRNPLVVAAWGAIVVALLAIGVLTLFIGLIVVLPVLGHATWHLYREAVVPRHAEP